jgi:hypothetical protein
MSSGKKTVLALAAIAAMLGCAALAAFVILVSDEPPPPDDSDLAFVRPEVPADQNAWTYYAQAVEKLSLPQGEDDSKWPPAPVAPATAVAKPAEEAVKAEPEDPPPDVVHRWFGIARNNAWEQPLVDAVLARNAEALALWEKGVARPSCLLPEVTEPIQKLRWDYSPQGIGDLVSVRARNLARQGNDEAAWQDAMRLVRFGYHLEAGKGLLNTYLTGASCKSAGCERMRELASKGGMSSDRLRGSVTDLARYQAEPQLLADALRAEYASWRITFAKFASGELAPSDVWQGDSLPTMYVERVVANLFKPNRTRRLIAETYREGIAAAPNRWADRPSFSKSRTTSWEEFTGGNYAGKLLCELCDFSMWRLYEMKCITNAEVAATRVLLAMKAFKLDKGRLPATLDELVPAYLDAVPLDDFDGKPFRYNPAKRIIYTVGEDLRDDGGTTKQEFLDAKMKEQGIDPKTADPETLKSLKEECEVIWQMPDPSFPIEF